MTASRNDTSGVLIDYVAEWLMQKALSGADVEDIFSGFCERLAASGLPLARVHLSFSMLHPLYRAASFTWRRGVGAKGEKHRHVQANMTDVFLKSPYFYLLSNNLNHMRRRIDGDAPVDFPILEDLRKEGLTDYLAIVHKFDPNSLQGMMGSWSTDRPEGFSEGAIAGLLKLQGQLAVTIKMSVLSRLADNVLTTYLGNEAGRRVLSGQIKRGDAETIRAALVMVDMRNSSNVAELHGRQVFIDTLNEFYDAIAAPFNRNGGQILSFMGDGFLAIYPCEKSKHQSQIAARAALAAVRNGVSRMSDLNRERLAKGLWQIDYGIGLHVGNVIFGNVGLADRLTFSTFGAAVNEVQRLESLSKKQSSKVIASEAFVGYCGGKWKLLGTEKLRGFEQPIKIFAPEAAKGKEKTPGSATRTEEDGMSDAEYLMVLHSKGGQAGQKPTEH
ncbi:MAG: adenylate/guanylate cyclase domain-containing protein [Hyphomicrobiales bacterium]